jgi:quinol monooxygenase YgiN
MKRGAVVSKVTVLYKMVAKPGRGDDVVAAFNDDVFATFEAEPGTEQYVLSQSLDNPDVLWCSEIFTDHDAFEAHRATARNGTFAPALQDLLESAEAIQGTPVKATGVEL